MKIDVHVSGSNSCFHTNFVVSLLPCRTQVHLTIGIYDCKIAIVLSDMNFRLIDRSHFRRFLCCVWTIKDFAILFSLFTFLPRNIFLILPKGMRFSERNKEKIHMHVYVYSMRVVCIHIYRGNYKRNYYK